MRTLGYEGTGASRSVGDESEDDATGGRGDESRRPEQPGFSLRDAECANDRGQDHRIEHDVEGVEHPSERGRDERVARGRFGRAPPGEASGCRGSRRIWPAGGTTWNGRAAACPFPAQNSNLTAISPWRDGALMYGRIWFT